LYFQGVELQQDIKNGVIISSQTLVLQKVGRAHSGSYRCHASNREGEGAAQPAINLTVRYAPVCRPDQTTVYGVARHETVRISCAVESLPDNELTFKWSFNNTRESLDIQQSNVRTAADGGPVSVLEYTPRTEMDYGTLLCRARNAVGLQAVPCAYQLVPAGPPDPVIGCQLTNQSFALLQLHCQPGFDGGLSQVAESRLVFFLS
jgi:Immunoglobulin domain